MTAPASPPSQPTAPPGHATDVVSLVPLHAVPDDGLGHRVERRRGRPRRATPAPNASQLDYDAGLAHIRHEWVDSDDLVQILGGRADFHDVIGAVKAGLAAEAASLKFEIEQHPSRETTAVAMSRRIDALTKLASIVLAELKIGGNGIDPSGAQMQRVYAAFVEKVEDVLDEVVPGETGVRFKSKLAAKLQGWEAAFQGT